MNIEVLVLIEKELFDSKSFLFSGTYFWTLLLNLNLCFSWNGCCQNIYFTSLQLALSFRSDKLFQYIHIFLFIIFFLTLFHFRTFVFLVIVSKLDTKSQGVITVEWSKRNDIREIFCLYQSASVLFQHTYILILGYYHNKKFWGIIHKSYGVVIGTFTCVS